MWGEGRLVGFESSLSAQGGFVQVDQIAQEMSDDANAAGLGEVGLGHEPDRLVNPKILVETGQIMWPSQEMRQNGKPKTFNARGELGGKRACRDHRSAALQQSFDPLSSREARMSFGPADDVVGVEGVRIRCRASRGNIAGRAV